VPQAELDKMTPELRQTMTFAVGIAYRNKRPSELVYKYFLVANSNA
jgi:hypothetical protein